MKGTGIKELCNHKVSDALASRVRKTGELDYTCQEAILGS